MTTHNAKASTIEIIRGLPTVPLDCTLDVNASQFVQRLLYFVPCRNALELAISMEASSAHLDSIEVVAASQRAQTYHCSAQTLLPAMASTALVPPDLQLGAPALAMLPPDRDGRSRLFSPESHHPAR